MRGLYYGGLSVAAFFTLLPAAADSANWSGAPSARLNPFISTRKEIPQHVDTELLRLAGARLRQAGLPGAPGGIRLRQPAAFCDPARGTHAVAGTCFPSEAGRSAWRSTALQYSWAAPASRSNWSNARLRACGRAAPFTTETRVPMRRTLPADLEAVGATVILNALIAVALAVFIDRFWHNFVFSQCIGLISYAAIDLPRRLTLA